MITVQIPADGDGWQVGGLVDVSHHALDLDRGLGPGESVVVRCLDDVAWLMEVEDIEFGLNETRYLLLARRRAVLPVEPPRRGRPITTAQTRRLLAMLATSPSPSPATGAAATEPGVRA